MLAPIAHGGESPNLFLPPTYDMLWSVVIIGPIFIFFLFYALPRINAQLDERSRIIKDGVESAERAREREALAKRHADEALAAANAEAGNIRSQANDDARAIVAKARQEAEAEAERILQAAQRQIVAERQAAEISLKSEVGLLATELAEKIVGEHLRDRELTSRVVDRFLDDLDAQLKTEEV